MGGPGREKKYVYEFSEGSRDMRELLGGKGANVAEMTRVLGPDKVPAGFTITTEACVAYMDADKRFPDGLDDQLAEKVALVESSMSYEHGMSLAAETCRLSSLTPSPEDWRRAPSRSGGARRSG